MLVTDLHDHNITAANLDVTCDRKYHITLSAAFYLGTCWVVVAMEVGCQATNVKPFVCDR